MGAYTHCIACIACASHPQSEAVGCASWHNSRARDCHGDKTCRPKLFGTLTGKVDRYVKSTNSWEKVVDMTHIRTHMRAYIYIYLYRDVS